MPCIHRIVKPQCRHFHANPSSRALSPLFALQALANSRETQHFNRASGLSRVDHSPNLELLRSSEVEPFKRKPAPPPDMRQPYSVEQQQAQVKNDAIPRVIPSALATNPLPAAFTRPENPSSSTSSTDAAALDVGRALIANHTAERDKLREALRVLEQKYEMSRKSWRNERKQFQEKIDDIEGRASMFFAISAAGFITFGIWWFKPRLDKYWHDKLAREQSILRQKTEAHGAEAKDRAAGRKKEQYSAIQPETAVLTAAEENIAPVRDAGKGSTGWFWR